MFASHITNDTSHNVHCAIQGTIVMFAAYHLNGSANRESPSRHGILSRLNSLKEQLSSSKMLHPRLVRIRASQLKQRISNQLKRINIPPPPEPPRLTSITLRPPSPINLPANPQETTLTLEGFETGATLDTGDTPESSEDEFDDHFEDESPEKLVSENSAPSSPNSLTTFDKIVIEKPVDPEEEKQKQESLERAQKLLADLQKSAPRRYEVDAKTTLSEQYLKNKTKLAVEDQTKSETSNFIKKIALDGGEMFDLNIVDSLGEDDSKSGSSENIAQVQMDSELKVSRSDDDLSKVVFGDWRTSSPGDSRSSSWGSRKDVPVVAVRPVGHEMSNNQTNNKQDALLYNKGIDDDERTISKEFLNKTEIDSSVFSDKLDYERLFSGLDDINPSFDMEINIDDVIQDNHVPQRNNETRGSKNSKDLKLVIPPPREFGDWEDTPNSAGTYDRQSSGDQSESFRSGEEGQDTPSAPVAPRRRKRKDKRPPAPPPPPPDRIGVTPNATPVDVSKSPVTLSEETPPRDQVSSPQSPVKPARPLSGPAVNAVGPVRVQSPGKPTRPTSGPTPRTPTSPVPDVTPVTLPETNTADSELPSAPVRTPKKAKSPSPLRVSIPARPVISDPIPTPELVAKPQVSKAIPLKSDGVNAVSTLDTQARGKRASLPAPGAPRHSKNERSNSLTRLNGTAGPLKLSSKAKGPAPLPPVGPPPVSAPASPCKPPSPSRAGLKVTFSEDLIIHSHADEKRASRPQSKHPPSPRQSPTKSILVRNNSDSDFR